MTRLLTTFLGAGLLSPAPGTWGSLAALPVAWLLHKIGGFPLLALATVLVFFIGWWATSIEVRGQENSDPSEIVIDEVVGQWIALWPLSWGAAGAGLDILALWPGWIAAFLLFRLFDVIKWGPVGWADRLHSPLGVMLDDVIAGLMAAIVVIGLAGLYHGVLL